MPKNNKANKNRKKFINDNPDVMVNSAKMTEQRPKPDAKELRNSDRTLDIVEARGRWGGREDGGDGGDGKDFSQISH